MRKITFATFFVAAFSLSTMAQTVVLSGNDARYTLFAQSVKSCDEFMCRFNGTEAFPGLNIEDTLGNLLMLFNSEMANSVPQKKFMSLLHDFQDSIHSNSVQLSYESTKWFAEEVIEFSIGKNTITLGIVLQPAKTSKGLFGWSIVGITGMGKAFGHYPEDKRYSISPEQNEAEFMELESIFHNETSEMSLFRSSSQGIDSLSYFFALIENGNLKFQKRISTTYHFLDVPSYVFDVAYFQRKSSNTGWLITDIKKMSEVEKNKYLRTLTSL